tara:strand:+ start:168 stop:338 length:171 start_codon:yes stop_codon:yes gene_type:complete
MRVLVENYGDARIFQDRPFGYRRYHVEWKDGRRTMYSGLWYSKNKVKKLVEAQLND